MSHADDLYCGLAGIARGFAGVARRAGRSDVAGMSGATWAVLLVLLVWCGWPAERAGAHETDQYTTPAGREFADVGGELTARFYEAIRDGVAELNREIEKAREAGDADRVRALHEPLAVAMAVNRQFPVAYSVIENLERRVHSEAWQRRHPGRVLGYKSQWATVSNRYLPLDPRWVFRIWHASTIKAFGVYLGTDKVGHITDMGKNYYLAYRRALRAGESEREAEDRAVDLGTEHFFYSESGVLGYISAGAYSNADLASNYIGFLFYRNLTEPVRLKGERRPAMLVRNGAKWELAPHVRRNSDFLSYFFSDHLDEALNSSLFESEIMRSSVRRVIRNRADALLWRYRDADGERRPPEYFQETAERLATYWGADYGHQGNDETLLTLGEVCYDRFEGDAEPGDRTHLGHTPLHAAVLAGDRAGVRRWIERGAAVDARVRSEAGYNSERGSTPLYLAVRDGRAAIAETLMRAGADVNARNTRGRTPLHRVGGAAGLAAQLLEAGADPDAADDRGRTPLHEAAGDGAVRTLRLLLGRGAAVSKRDREGRTALHAAAQAGHQEVMAELIEAGAKVTAASEAGRTALHAAAKAGHRAVVAELIEAGAEVNARDTFGYTPLHEAARAGRTVTVAVLLDEGASVEVADAYGTRPLHLACRFGRVDAAERLLNAGAAVSVANAAGRMPLHEAASAGCLPLIRTLVARGATPEAIDGQGATPEDLADEGGYPKVTRILRELEPSRS